MKCLLGVIIAAMLVIFTSCAGSSEVTPSPTNSPSQPQLSPTLGWKSYVYRGELPPVNIDQLPVFVFEESEDCNYHFEGNTYFPVSTPTDKIGESTTSAWRITLDTFFPLGAITDDSVIFASNSPAPLVLLIKNYTTDEIQCLYREDVLSNLPSAITGEEYFLYIGDKRVDCDEALAYIWNAHVSTDELQKGYGALILDGTSDRYIVTFVRRECPSICYELRYEIAEGELYVENINMDHVVVLPAPK